MKEIRSLHRLGAALCLCVLLLLQYLALPVAAASEREEDTQALVLPDAYTHLGEALPEELATLLPEGFLSQDPAEAMTALKQMTGVTAMLHVLLNAIGLHLKEGLSLLSVLMGILLLAAVLRTLSNAVGHTGGKLFSFCMKLSLYVAMLAITAGMIQTVTGYLHQLMQLTSALLPLVGVLYVSGGQVTQAAISEGILVTHLTIMQYIGTQVTPPVCSLCLAMSFFDGLNTQVHTAALSTWIKKTYTSLLGVITFLLSTSLGMQSILAARADTLRMRGVKYAVGNMIPVVGGAISGTLGTVATGVATLRSICGVSGLILLGLLLLPVLVELLLFRQVIHIASVFASMLSCDGEARLLGEMAGLYGYMAAAVSLCSLLTILTLGLLAGGHMVI